jgi:hypothetical protein
MGVMTLTAPSSPPRPWDRALTRRTLLAASAAGVVLLAAGCTSSPAVDRQDLVTDEQADLLADQVTAQAALVAAIEAAGTADPALAAAVPDLAREAGAQLERLRAAAPGSSPPGSTAPAPPSPAEARAWLRAQVAATATSHASACLDQSGTRAALLGSIAAGLRGHDGRLA